MLLKVQDRAHPVSVLAQANRAQPYSRARHISCRGEFIQFPLRLIADDGDATPDPDISKVRRHSVSSATPA